jgi:cytoplasmic iron level regulating protein YaaA (DUF328/UPF0246 family)
MEQALLDQLQQLPESVQQQATHYIQHLIAQHAKTTPDQTASDKTTSDKTASDKTASDKTTSDKTASDKTTISRKDAFGIWKGQVWMAEDFDAPLEDMQEYM